MNHVNNIEESISSLGLTKICELLQQETNQAFSIQQINHWRRRGVPYRWQDAFCAITGLDKSVLRVSKISKKSSV